MPETLNIIDQSLQEAEEQLLQEFDRIRNTLSDARFESIDIGVKTALTSVIGELHEKLEQTGDANNLQLMTQRHEVLLARFAVLRQLLNTKVPTAFLHEAHKEVTGTRRELEARVKAQRRRNESAESEENTEKSSGIVGKLKGMFAGDKPNKDNTKRNTIRVTASEQESLEPVNIYLDNGIYSASRELAALAHVFSLPAQEKEVLQETHEKKMRAVITGKASFDSRELSTKPPTIGDAKETDTQNEDPPLDRSKLAQTPEEIRRKLSERQTSETGKASFTSKDVQHEEALSQPTSSTNETNVKPTLSATQIASQRKAELDAEKAKQPTTGKASFLSKDIEPIVPQEAPRKRSTPEPISADRPETTDQQPRSGKAVFESRDLSKTQPLTKK